MRGEDEFDPQQNSEAAFSNRTVRFGVRVGSVSHRGGACMVFCECEAEQER